ncbi:MAG: hypothetical protein ACRCYX_15755 [Dermatophilaceae bacterium]
MPTNQSRRRARGDLGSGDRFLSKRAAVRHGQNTLDVLIQAADGHPWIPAT